MKNENTEDSRKYTEWILRGAVALIIFIGNNALSQLTDQGEELQKASATLLKIQLQSEYSNKELVKLRDNQNKFASKEDLKSSNEVVLDQTNTNTKELNQRSGFIKETNAKITKLQFEYNDHEKRIIKLEARH